VVRLAAVPAVLSSYSWWREDHAITTCCSSAATPRPTGTGRIAPEVVADRILNFARVVGRENVIAGTDCGLGGRIHPQLVWAKLAVLVEGAKLATKELYGSIARRGSSHPATSGEEMP
jgi:hypothetical protein